MKTLKQFLEVYEPKSPDEKRFKDKHVTIKHQDRNGNGDDVFQATNVKKAERTKERHGYEPGEDEKVYEEKDMPFEGPYRDAGERKDKYGNPIKNVAKHLAKKAMNAQKNEEVEIEEVTQAEMDAFLVKGGKVTSLKARKARGVGSIINQFGSRKIGKSGYDKKTSGLAANTRAGNRPVVREEADLEEKTLTPAEIKKREEVAQAIERDNPKMPMDKKMAIATATAKKVAEGVAFAAAKKYGTPKEEVVVEEVTADEAVAQIFESGAVHKLYQPALLNIFEQLSDENQVKFAEQLQTPEGVESLINFAIQNRGE
jgi:hypothetical protein